MSWYDLYLAYLTVLHEFQAHLQNISVVAIIISFSVSLIIILFIDYFVFKKIYITHEIVSSLYITFLLSLTVLGRYPNVSSSVDTLFITYVQAGDGNEGARYAILFNIILFVPLGILITRYLRESKFAVAVLFLLPLAIELAQLITTRGVFEISDIINNFIGGMIGLGTAYLVVSLYRYIKNVYIATKKKG